MARVTRSKTVDISEDQTASPVTSITQLTTFPARSDQQLTELSNTNAMALQNPLAAELKGLKAAYRSAIGGGRKAPKRNKKQEKKGDMVTGSSETLDAPLNTNHTSQASHSNLLFTEESQFAHFDRLSIYDLTETSDEHQRFELLIQETPPPERRTTRRQAAKAQAEERALAKSTTGDFEDVESVATTVQPRVTRAKASVKGNLVGKFDTMAKEQVISDAVPENLTPQGYTPASPSPSKSAKSLQEVERNLSLSRQGMTLDDEEDSFLEQIIARSPAKPVTRIEDSVEALDQLEEALEALDNATLAETMASPKKTRKKPLKELRDPVESVVVPEKRRLERRPLHEDTFRPLPARSQSTKSGYSSMRVKSVSAKTPMIKKATSMVFRSQTPSEEKATPQPKPKFSANARPLSATKGPVSASKRPLSMFVKSLEAPEKSRPESATKTQSKRPISLLPPSHTVKSNKPATKASFELPGEAISRRLKEQREARQARKEASEDNAVIVRTVSGPQVKSTKPLTVSNFELPGEAISRRKKEALEARLKAEEEAERKRREFKAKPLLKTVVPNAIPRETAASRARHSQIGLENSFENGASKRNSTMSSVGAHRPSLAHAVAANIASPRAPGPMPTLSRKASTVSASGLNMSGKAMQRSVSATEVQMQRQRAKEAYNRDAKLTEEIENERREREAAARRAREEAAERGRQASREWADRQLAKKMADGDKGMSAGYGAGGQMGLREEKFCVGAVFLG